MLQEMIRRINAKHKGRVPPGYMVVQDPATGRYRAMPPEEQAALPFA